jgi:hypothetical protein
MVVDDKFSPEADPKDGSVSIFAHGVGFFYLFSREAGNSSLDPNQC